MTNPQQTQATETTTYALCTGSGPIRLDEEDRTMAGTHVYMAKIDISRISDDGCSTGEWMRWCDRVDSEGQPIPEDSRVRLVLEAWHLPSGASGDVDTWSITARSPSEARRIVEAYAHAVGVDVSIRSVEVSP